MTANPPRPPLPPHLQPRKGLATSQGSSLSVAASNSPAISRSSSHAKVPQVSKISNNADLTSEKATVALIRRWLVSSSTYGDASAAQKPIEELLPPLTSSNEVDLQLYAIIAIIIKDLVYAWYTKITPDHVFVDEVIRIIAHCTRALEERLRRFDISELVLDEIPALIDAHVQAYRIATASSNSSPYGASARQLYHSLNAHPAFDPIPDSSAEASTQQAQNEAVYRQLLIRGTLAVLLPTEDLENICLRTLVSDVIADLILGQVVGTKACQPWFVWDAITKVVEAVKSRIKPKATGEEMEHDTRSRLEKFGLLSAKSETLQSDSPTPRQSKFAALFWRTLQYIYLSFLFLRFLITGLFETRSTRPQARAAAPPRSNPSSPSVQGKNSGQLTPSSSWSGSPLAPKRPVLDYRLLSMMARLLDLSTRMPWLLGSLSWCQHIILSGAGRVGARDGILDRFLKTTTRSHLLAPSLLPPLLKQFRATVFPHNSLGPPSPPPPSPDQQLAIRRKCATEILSLIPLPVARTFFAVSIPKDDLGRAQKEEEAMASQVEERMLDVFGDAYMNKHLIYAILEAVLLKVVPELAESTPNELLKERIGGGEI